MDVGTLRELLVEERERLERELRRVARDRGRPAHEAAEVAPVAPADAAERELDDSLELNAEAVLEEIGAPWSGSRSAPTAPARAASGPSPRRASTRCRTPNRCIDCKRLEERG